MRRPLDGITVVSLEHAIAAPFCTRQLADLGARVIKVERPGGGDFARSYDQRVRGMASHFVWTNRSKESLALDLKQPEALALLMQLLRKADVLVQNLAPGAAARMGLSFDALHACHPRLIVCDISGYGEDGPYRDKKAYDLLIQSEAGMLSVTGTPEDPCKTGNSIADIAAAMVAYSGILAALLQRGHSGEGSHIDVSMLESLAEWMGYVKNHNLGLEVPYRYGSEMRQYRPDFIVRIDDGHGEGDLLNLVVEIKGFRGEDAKVKKETMDTYWVPGVNHLGTHGRWAFAEFTEVYQMQADFATKVDAAFNQMLENALHTSIVPV